MSADSTNIGARGATRRRRTGIAWGAIAAIVGAVLVIRHASPLLAAAFGIAVAMSALGFLQARERT